MKSDPNFIGDMNELKACVWLMQKGFEVFRNVGCTGKVDLVIRDTQGLLKPVQVKTAQMSSKTHELKFRYQGQNEDVRVGIRTLWVYYSQVGWNRDYFDMDFAKAEYGKYLPIAVL